MPSLSMSFIPSPSLTVSLTSPPLIMPPTHSNSSIGSTILAGLIEGATFAVVTIFTFLLVIVICHIKKKRRNHHSDGQHDLPLPSNANIEPRDNPAYANVNSFYDSATAIQDDPANATVNVNDLSATIQDIPAYGNNTAMMENVPYACLNASSHTAFEENTDQMNNDDNDVRDRESAN